MPKYNSDWIRHWRSWRSFWITLLSFSQKALKKKWYFLGSTKWRSNEVTFLRLPVCPEFFSGTVCSNFLIFLHEVRVSSNLKKWRGASFRKILFLSLSAKRGQSWHKWSFLKNQHIKLNTKSKSNITNRKPWSCL